VFDEELPLILHHHERYDGDGYPHGLKAEDIPLGSRIICVTEAFDGLTAGAVYRAAVSAEKALAELTRCAGTHFDPKLVNIIISLIGRNDLSGNDPEA
jgi:HD-GYP domain-containing protein (c-di-GMP phosphodiesterase class II)